MQKIKLLNILLVLISIWALTQCNPNQEANNEEQIPVTANDFINKSIAYHDPENHWSSYEVKVNNHIEMADTTLPRVERSIFLNNAKGIFSVNATIDGHDFNATVKPDTSYVTWGKPDPTKQDSLRYGLDGSGAQRMYNYHRYLQGIPMVLKDEGTIVSDSIYTDYIEGKAHKVITVNYLPEGQHPTWQFYINEEDYAVTWAKFFRLTQQGDSTGEYIKFKSPIVVNGIKRYRTFVWEYLNGKPLATDNYEFLE
ncbi:DUF6503 family protein [Fulvivirgaceae bacterium BMA10]|uniref:DUF6503 family protein n=1 Tax=Splendidivirga corallicola TaxID=3051826 RepID=A0ABT8KMU1_9BACT|nr:DUF6503 family protein [Fulvivirgaceae bacterium BMA10]